MPKLFLFSIGGTGIRVVKALTMLLASGVELKDTECIVPIIIDPDTSNGDLTRTIEQIREYRRIYNLGHSSQSKFFQTKISSLDELGDANLASDTFRFDIAGVQNQLFKDFINYAGLSRENKAFTSLLFSKDNLDADMEVGFKGNPNIGSVVINKLKDSGFYTRFAQNFADGDRIFIISSIFGGTGAAGFPLILKNIRSADAGIPNHAFLRTAKIGAITMLPYFGVDNIAGTTSIDSDSFISKSKAALQYYSKNVTGNNSIDALYYIGDNTTNLQVGADGSNSQRNKAHFLEISAALSIIDFMQKDDAYLTVPYFSEFGIKTDTASITFNNLDNQTKNIIASPLTSFALFNTFMSYHYSNYANKQGEAWASDGINKLNSSSLNQNFLNDVKSFALRFYEWLNEMRNSQVSFNAINIRTEEADMYNLVTDANAKNGLITNFIGGRGLTHFRTQLSTNQKTFDALLSPQKMLALLSTISEKVYQNRIN